MSGRPALFLDRDGTLCREVGYLADPDRLELIDGAGAALERARRQGYRIHLVTNQSGIARGLVEAETLERIHERLGRLLAASGGRLDGIQVCPHAPGPDGGERCDCRKPQPGLIRDAAAADGIDLARSWTIGDRWRDLIAGRRAGTRTIGVRTGYGADEFRYPSRDGCAADRLVDDLQQAVDWILGLQTAGKSEA